MIVNKGYETIIVLYLSTILTEKGLDKNIQIKHELTGISSLGMLKIEEKNPRRGTPLPWPQCQFPSFPACYAI